MFRQRSSARWNRFVRCVRGVVSTALVVALTVLGMPVVPAAQEPVPGTGGRGSSRPPPVARL